MAMGEGGGTRSTLLEACGLADQRVMRQPDAWRNRPAQVITFGAEHIVVVAGTEVDHDGLGAVRS